jgi:hypothetical protein
VTSQQLREQRKADQHTAFQRERKLQLGGLLVVAVLWLAGTLLRARPLLLFHAGWWRL